MFFKAAKVEFMKRGCNSCQGMDVHTLKTPRVYDIATHTERVMSQLTYTMKQFTDYPGKIRKHLLFAEVHYVSVLQEKKIKIKKALLICLYFFYFLIHIPIIFT